MENYFYFSAMREDFSEELALFFKLQEMGIISTGEERRKKNLYTE